MFTHSHRARLVCIGIGVRKCLAFVCYSRQGAAWCCSLSLNINDKPSDFSIAYINCNYEPAFNMQWRKNFKFYFVNLMDIFVYFMLKVLTLQYFGDQYYNRSKFEDRLLKSANYSNCMSQSEINLFLRICA